MRGSTGAKGRHLGRHDIAHTVLHLQQKPGVKKALKNSSAFHSLKVDFITTGIPIAVGTVFLLPVVIWDFSIPVRMKLPVAGMV